MSLKNLIGAVAIWLASSAAANAVSLTVQNGELVGATEVIVNGSLYNVSFSQQSCAALYSGCDEDSDFVFNTQDEAGAASQALLDQVFSDTAEGNFDTDAALTRGCGFVPFCFVYTPYEMLGENVVLAKAALNYGYRSDQDQVYDPVKGFLSDDTSVTSGIYFAFAQWSASANQNVVVNPLPAGVLLLLSGLFGFAVVGVRKQRAQA